MRATITTIQPSHGKREPFIPRPSNEEVRLHTSSGKPTWRLLLSRLFSYTGVFWVANSVLVLLVAGCAHSGPQLSVPDQYVLAYTRPGSPARVETVASNGGGIWSAPNSPRDAQGNPLPTSGVPPGIGANTREYMLAWFDSNGTLNSVTSANSSSWGNLQTHGTFSVNINSRPSVAYHYGQQSWFVAFLNNTNAIIVLPVRPTTGVAVTVAGVTTSLPPTMEFWNNELLIAYKGGGLNVSLVRSGDGAAWSTASSLQVGNAPITT